MIHSFYKYRLPFTYYHYYIICHLRDIRNVKSTFAYNYPNYDKLQTYKSTTMGNSIDRHIDFIIDCTCKIIISNHLLVHARHAITR